MPGEVSLFIPSYNAAATLGDVVDRIPEGLWDSIRRVYMIDDGSKDATLRVMEGITARYHKCVAVVHDGNRGYGGTVKHGLALCKDDGCRFAVCLHADGQYPPESIGEFVAKMKKEHVDLLQGSRIASGTALSGGMPLYKYIAGRLLTAIENSVFGLALSDYHSGFLVYGHRVLAHILFENLSGSFDFDLEVIAATRAAGLSVGELPIPTRYAGEKSYLNPVIYGLRVLRVVARYGAGRYRSGHRHLTKGVTGE
jgi:glycosyltransferase involved in cell wall biosynthesis